MNKKQTGAVIATVVAGLILGGNLKAATETKPAEGKVKCSGINACKGKTACASAENACTGHNSCKGKGWIYEKSEKECTDKGGKVVKDKA